MLYLDKRGVNIPVVAAELEEILTNNEKLAAKIKYKNTIYFELITSKVLT